jgi:glycerol-3-phosphate acyltransferase PlsX
MGGDHAPQEILKGCFEAASLLEPDDVIFLVGDASIINPALAAANIPAGKRGNYKVVHTTEIVAMDESPADAIRKKPDSSINVQAKMAAAGECDVVISAGNTGACVAAAQLRMRTLPGVSRPGIGVVFPSAAGNVVLCDVGANPEPKPHHFHQYAIMASAYATAVCGIANPRVGLLSIGEEESKGNTLTKESRKLLRDEPQINFVGNVEGRDLFKGTVDVIICDGFAGNVVLKCVEGMAEGLFKAIVGEITESAPELMAGFKPVMKKIYQQHDWQEAGGAPLLGVNGYSIICHGKSEGRAIKNAIRVGKQLFAAKMNDKIVAALSKAVKTEPPPETAASSGAPGASTSAPAAQPR